MKAMISLIIILSLLATTAPAQMSPDAARARMQARQKQRAAERAQTVTITRGELDDMRAEISILRAEVAALRAAATTRPARMFRHARKATSVPTPTEKAVREHRLMLGMSLDDANAAMGGAGTLISESDGEQTYRWSKQSIGGSFGGARPEFVPVTHDTLAVFSSGKLVRWDSY